MKMTLDDLKRDESFNKYRFELGEEAMNVLHRWYSLLVDMGYSISSNNGFPILIRLSDNKELALVHRIEDNAISVLPILSCD